MVKYYFLSLVLFILVTRGCWACNANDILIVVGISGRQIQGKPEYSVFVINRCNCPVEGLMVACPDFQTVEPVDPIYMIRDHNGRCLINQSHAMPPRSTIQFRYAWDQKFEFPVIQMKAVGC